jgi:hypothetical protein
MHHRRPHQPRERKRLEIDVTMDHVERIGVPEDHPELAHVGGVEVVAVGGVDADGVLGHCH